jgi:hypothetical protein
MGERGEREWDKGRSMEQRGEGRLLLYLIAVPIII